MQLMSPRSIAKACGSAWLRATVLIACINAMLPGTTWAEAPKPPSSKSGDKVTLTKDQMRQIVTVKVENCTFRALKPGIGQIAFNEDASTVVLTPFSGRVTKLLAKAGDQIARGSPLFELESPEVVQAQTDLLSALQGVGKANAQSSLTKRALDRQSTLINVKATSQREVDQARNDFAAADADFKTAENALTAARKRLRVLIGRSDDEIARLERDRVINPLITVNAPIDGTIVSRKIGPGQYVRTDANEPLLVIADLATMWLKAAVPESDIPFIRVGQDIEVNVVALPGRTFKAKVSTIGASSDTTTRRVIVRSELPNPDAALKADMFATFKIATEGVEQAPGVPTEALVRDGETAVVWVQQSEPLVFQRRKVKIGREQDGLVHIQSGVKTGEVVAARGAVFIDNEWNQ